ncbi:hypothetical protein OIDMADRAFT_130426 [Oidiodendron maius Zn]|uniref:Uncharacterized protein n=1 Tax=Oidiodendron maius (strain Zn) TaxID=913774 RepID=A0A0C3GM14_OIDMZ|nr:hypothetical protein OIDMADRAFT_130426 [Oidiodendron maius Zn]
MPTTNKVNASLTLDGEKYNSFVSPSQYGLPRSSAELKLSPLDMHMPRVYVPRWILCFPLKIGVEKDQIYENLKLGLAHTISSIPWIAGRIGPCEGRDPRENWIQILDSLSGVNFPYNDLSELLPSYAALHAEHFPLSRLKTTPFLPIGLLPETPHPPVMAAQANFIEGGLLLAIGIHHSVSDASAVGAILNIWAQNTAVAWGSTELNFSRFEPQCKDRSPLMLGTSGAKMVDFPEYYLQATAITTVADGNSDRRTSTPLKLPPMTARIFHFSPSTLAALKAEAAAYSTNDALTAFLWRHMTLARNPVSQSKPAAHKIGETSTVLYAANIRRRTSPPLPQNFLGNAFIAVKTDGLDISTLMSSSGLKIATSTIRKSLRRLTDVPNHISLTIGLMEQFGPTELKYAYNGFLGPDIMATSWADVGVYNNVWGDLGKAECFRIPGEGSDGNMAVFPRLKNGGLEVWVALKTEVMERLVGDRDFLAKAELWA